MKNKIVKELRNVAAEYNDGESDFDLLHDAADAIERLQRENAALREALRKIEAYEPLTFAECSDAEAVIALARDALDGKQSSQVPYSEKP